MSTVYASKLAPTSALSAKVYGEAVRRNRVIKTAAVVPVETRRKEAIERDLDNGRLSDGTYIRKGMPWLKSRRKDNQ